MQMTGWRQGLFIVAALTFLASAPAMAQRLEFSGNGVWGKVKTPAYEAVVERSGSFVFNATETVPIKISLIRQWVAFQNFPQLRLMRAKREASPDSSNLTLEFRYHWDEGSVLETLRFDSWGVEANYEFTPWQDRDLTFLAIYMEPQGQFKDNLKFIGLAAIQGQDRVLEIGPESKPKEHFTSLSLRDSGPYTVDLLGIGNSFLSIESFPKALLHNHGTLGTWRPHYKTGDTLKLSYRIFISQANGRNIPPSSVEFME